MWFTLALSLGGRTVAELQRSMTQREFERWRDFYGRFPFDHTHLHYRPAALISQSMSSGGDINDKIEWLARPFITDPTDADIRTMKAFGFSPRDK